MLIVIIISHSLFQLSKTLLNEVYLSMFIYTFISDTSRILFIVSFTVLMLSLKVEWSEPIIYLSLDTHTHHNLTYMTSQPLYLFYLKIWTFIVTNQSCRQTLMSIEKPKTDYFFFVSPTSIKVWIYIYTYIIWHVVNILIINSRMRKVSIVCTYTNPFMFIIYSFTMVNSSVTCVRTSDYDVTKNRKKRISCHQQ